MHDYENLDTDSVGQSEASEVSGASEAARPLREAEAQVIAHWRDRWETMDHRDGPVHPHDKHLVQVVEQHCGAVRGRAVLEVGVGQGGIALAFAERGAVVTIVDAVEKAVACSSERLAAQGHEVQAHQASATALPFPDNEFEIVVSGGLLEHFDEPLRLAILREMTRVCCGHVVTLIPNGADPLYRLAKFELKRTGRWQWGEEHSLTCLADEYQAAGLELVHETSYDFDNTVMLLQDALCLTPDQVAALRAWYSDEAPSLRGASLGYRLVAIGVVTK